MAKAVVRFNVQNPRAVRQIEEFAGTKIVAITADTVETVRLTIAEGYKQGLGPIQIALDLAGRLDAKGRRKGGVLGMNPQQTQWAMNYRGWLMQPDPAAWANALTYGLRDKRYDAKLQRAIKTGKKLPQADITRMVNRYIDNAVRLRGETVARTETGMAVHKAAHEAFRQTLDQTEYTPDDVTRTWRSAGDERVRDTHVEMNGVTVYGLDTPYVLPEGDRMMHPLDSSLGARPEEIINCRCDEEINIDFAAPLRRLEQAKVVFGRKRKPPTDMPMPSVDPAGQRMIRDLKGNRIEAPTTFYRGENPGDVRRIKTGATDWDSYLFISSSREGAGMYGSQITTYQAMPGARIAYEGTAEWKKIVGSPRKNESLLTYADRAAKALKAEGYDAAWFQRQSDIGTAVFSREKFVVVTDRLPSGAAPRTGNFFSTEPALPQAAYEAKTDLLRPTVYKVAEDLEFPKGKIMFSNFDYNFELNGKQFQAAASASRDTGIVTVYSARSSVENIAGTMAHEIQHQKFNKYLADESRELKEISALPKDPRGRRFDVLKADGSFRDPEMAKQFPVYESYRKIDYAALKESDGITDYSREWWQAYEAGTSDALKAIHETLAEMAMIEYQDPGTLQRMIARRPGSPWGDLYAAINENWKRRP